MTTFASQPARTSPKPSPGPGYRAPLQNGEAGTAQTIKLMRQLVDAALTDPSFVRFAKDIVRSVRAHDEFGEAEALYNWVARNIRFTKDPLTKETLYPPQELLKIRSGDCDDISMLLGALLLAIGYPARLITISAVAEFPAEFSHVYIETEIPPGSGNWIALDAARYGARFGVEPPIYYRKRAWSLVDDSFQDLSGATRLRGLAGYTRVGLGDDSGDGFDWSGLIKQAVQETPQIISAVEGQPSMVRNAAGVVQTGPYGSFATPFTPGYGIPAAGYNAQASISTSSWVLPAVIGIGLILMLKGKS